jgi:hypothetical protein
MRPVKRRLAHFPRICKPTDFLNENGDRHYNGLRFEQHERTSCCGASPHFHQRQTNPSNRVGIVPGSANYFQMIPGLSGRFFPGNAPFAQPPLASLKNWVYNHRTLAYVTCIEGEWYGND